jgi:hypothetical protein
MNKQLLYLFLVSCTACNLQEKEPLTIFSGEIVNPTSQVVFLYKDDVVIDSAHLDMHNRFSMKLENLKEGLYNFQHAPQYQYVYLSQGDSLLIRLNTLYFDESLVFSGKGEEINNFLIEIFLSSEEEEEIVDNYYQLEPNNFSKKIDSLHQAKITLLDELQTEIKLSPSILAMAEASIDYNSYIYKEKYPFEKYKNSNKTTFDKISGDFYTYRKELNFNNEELTYFTPYYDFMKRYFDNLAYAYCATDCDIENKTIKNQLHFNSHKLVLIDSIVQEKKLRDNLFRNVALTYFLKIHDNVNNNKLFFDEFKKLSGNNKHIKEIYNIYEGVLKMQPEHELPDLKVLDSLGNQTSIKALAQQNKNVVFYFWTNKNNRHFKNITNQAKKMADLHPEISFIAISLTSDHDHWKDTITESNHPFKNEYRAADIDSVRNTLIIDGLNKAIVIKDGIIVDAYKDMYSLFQ